jgi:hypothetical protein
MTPRMSKLLVESWLCLLLCLTSASCTLSKLQGPTDLSEVRIALPCPRKGDGYCLLSAKGRWSAPLGATWGGVTEVRQTASGSGVALVRGHEESGRLVAFDRDGRLQFVLNLEQGYSLGMVVGALPRGLTLCDGSPWDYKQLWCDVFVPGSGMPLGDAPRFPEGCGFPRSYGGQIFCAQLVGQGNGLAIQEQGEGGRFNRVASVTAEAYDLQVLDGDHFVVLTTDFQLLVLDRSSRSMVLSASPVRWAAVVGSSVMFGLCGESMCRVMQAEANGSEKEVWSSKTLIPGTGQALSGRLIVDAVSRDGAEREILSIGGSKPVVDTLWRKGSK